MTLTSAKRNHGTFWFDDVPPHWEQMRLKDVVEGCLNGFWGDDPNGDETNTPVIRVADFDRNGRRATEGPTLRSVKHDQKAGRLLEKGDLLIEKSGGGELQPVGMVVEFQGVPGSICSNFVARMRPREFASSRYLTYLHAYFYALSVTTRSIKQSTGIQNLDSAAYLGESCFLPPKDEQIAIAAYLDAEIARIDGLISEKRKLRHALDDLKVTRITEILTGADCPQTTTGSEWIPSIPEGWELKRLKFFGQVRSGVAKGKKYDGQTTIEMPYLRVANVQDGYLDLDEISMIEVSTGEVSRYTLVPGDVLMSEGGDYDKLGRGAVWAGQIENCLHQNHVFAVRLDDVTLSSWISAITQTAYAKFYFMNNSKQSTNLASINQGNVKEFPVVMPPTDERIRRQKMLKDALEQIDKLADHATREIGLLTELRTSTITDAVLGRIDVRKTKNN